MKEMVTTTSIDWNMFLEEDTKKMFNKFLKKNIDVITSKKSEISYTAFSDVLMKSAKVIKLPHKVDSPG